MYVMGGAFPTDIAPLWGAPHWAGWADVLGLDLFHQWEKEQKKSASTRGAFKLF